MLPSRALRLALIACTPLLAVACGKLDGETTNAATGGAPPGVATGNLEVRLAVTGTNLDGDERDVTAVNVTVSEVVIFPREDSGMGVGAVGPVTLLGGSAGFNLLSLVGNPVTLMAGPVPAATYERLRVVVSGASVTIQNGETNSLEIENGTVERGIDVDVNAGQTATVTVTINIRESLRLNKNNRGSFRPQINVSD